MRSKDITKMPEAQDSTRSKGKDKKKRFSPIEQAAKAQKDCYTQGSSSAEIIRKYVTDRGNPIKIYSAQSMQYSPDERILQDAKEIREEFKAAHLSITESIGINRDNNCHSFVFTNGEAGWISPQEVEHIIRENKFQEIASRDSDGYTYTQKPKEGDIIIYRDKNNEIEHSGVVVVADKDPTKMMIRTKWGYGQILNHSAVIPNINNITHWEIYRSNRAQGRLITEDSGKHRSNSVLLLYRYACAEWRGSYGCDRT